MEIKFENHSYPIMWPLMLNGTCSSNDFWIAPGSGRCWIILTYSRKKESSTHHWSWTELLLSYPGSIIMSESQLSRALTYLTQILVLHWWKKKLSTALNWSIKFPDLIVNCLMRSGMVGKYKTAQVYLEYHWLLLATPCWCFSCCDTINGLTFSKWWSKV